VNALILPPSSFQHNPEATGYGITHGDSALVTSETHTGEQDGNLIDWDIPDIDFSELISPEMNSIAPDPPPSWQPYADRVSMVDQIHSVNWSIPPQPTANPRLFKKRPETRPDVQRARVLIQHTLKSYLLTMLRHNSLPPFIHQSLTSRRSEMEALDDCISLVHMISGETRGSRKLFWKNVQMECERMYREVG
jgi:hypothetical protein